MTTNALWELSREVVALEAELVEADLRAKTTEQKARNAHDASQRASYHAHDLREKLRVTNEALDVIVKRDNVSPDANIKAQIAAGKF